MNDTTVQFVMERLFQAPPVLVAFVFGTFWTLAAMGWLSGPRTSCNLGRLRTYGTFTALVALSAMTALEILSIKAGLPSNPIVLLAMCSTLMLAACCAATRCRVHLRDGRVTREHLLLGIKISPCPHFSKDSDSSTQQSSASATEQAIL